MFTQVIAAAKCVVGLNRQGRNMVVFPDDVFIVSYPKSGNTWTRFLVANLVYPNEHVSFANINHLIPDPEALSKREMNCLPGPRYIKSHQYFDPRYLKIVYIVRDPRDVALSQYHFHQKRRLLQDGAPVEQFVARFVAGSTSPYASWAENVAGWLSTRYGRPGFLLLRYEDMMADTTHELAKLALFLGIAADLPRLQQVVASSSADRMRKLEAHQAGLWSSTKDTRQDVPFVREAKAGGWKLGLPQSSVAEIEGAWGHLMQFLGYDLTTGKGRDTASLFDSLLVGSVNDLRRKARC
jgi:sulfotransferase family protein